MASCLPRVHRFEAGDEVGGRVKELVYQGAPLELGASIIWGNNLYLKQAAAEVGLTAVVPGGNDYTLYNGTHLVFSTVSGSYLLSTGAITSYAVTT